ncbi:hypothetical protein GPECTOR_1g850 [Gonium pectorale]|uniref:carnosine N-methyltransferase n=1 Tax=Gonium pectorale TaxID=33097 RepID=A0A150H4F5_GONPE|nr:hypothetical protein GPECTOR_1g850 [Gonium pectorale]|eukprot:KXZ56943.1 hypothetical protein GPECTOR_1g850 [Gonium pectorale]
MEVEREVDDSDERLRVQEDDEEKAALLRIILAFRDYASSAEWEVARWQSNFAQLPPHHKALLPGHAAKLAEARRAIQTNSFLIKSLLAAFDPECASGPLPPHLLPSGGGAGGEGAGAQGQSAKRPEDQPVSAHDADKVDRSNPHRPPRVLIPGAGLGRLCVDVAALGYEAQGNEFSYYMLLASSFILNSTTEVGQYTIHPWIHSNCNHLTDADQLRAVPVPDVVPGEALPGPGLLSMCAGDFVEVYGAPDMAGMFDCVATCFFIDTAHNVLRYLEVLSHVLAPGGRWAPELSIELSLDDVRSAAQAMGFRLVKEEVVDVPYMADYRSMYKTVYQASFWTMVKEREWTPPPPLPQQQLQGQTGSAERPPPPPPPPRSQAAS